MNVGFFVFFGFGFIIGFKTETEKPLLFGFQCPRRNKVDYGPNPVLLAQIEIPPQLRTTYSGREFYVIVVLSKWGEF